jgi:hypothetical protein
VKDSQNVLEEEGTMSAAAPSETRDRVSGAVAPAPVEGTPVFVDATGHRRRWLRVVGYIAALGCVIYAVILVTSLLFGPITPDRSHAAPTAPHSSTSQSISSTNGPGGHAPSGHGPDKKAGGI